MYHIVGAPPPRLRTVLPTCENFLTPDGEIGNESPYLLILDARLSTPNKIAKDGNRLQEVDFIVTGLRYGTRNGGGFSGAGAMSGSPPAILRWPQLLGTMSAVSWCLTYQCAFASSIVQRVSHGSAPPVTLCAILCDCAPL